MTDKANATRTEAQEMSERFRDLRKHAGEQITHGEGNGYVGSDGRVCMIRCFSCGLENYAPTVASGMCGWCTYDFNDDIKAVLEKLGQSY